MFSVPAFVTRQADGEEEEAVVLSITHFTVSPRFPMCVCVCECVLPAVASFPCRPRRAILLSSVCCVLSLLSSASRFVDSFNSRLQEWRTCALGA